VPAGAAATRSRIASRDADPRKPGEGSVKVSIIFLFSGSYCHGEEVAVAVGRELGYAQGDEELLKLAAQRSGSPEQKLLRAMHGPPPFFNKLTREREKNLALLEVALAELATRDNLVFHGLAGHLLPRTITHVLRVCLIAKLEYRVALTVKETGVLEKEAIKIVNRDDAERIRWTRLLFGQEPYTEGLYDILLPMHTTSVPQAVGIICENARKEAIQTTPASRQAVADFLLAARVHAELTDHGHDVEVTATNGNLSIGINKYVMRLEQHEKKLAALAQRIEGVNSVTCSPGSRFIPPPLVGPADLDVPSKILLVDDEREFVHTLSERLQTRQLDSEVVYDGEQALAVLASEPPEVMVLDLKMPGIDGIEVLRRVKQSHPQVEVIILTGHGSEREEKLAFELGAFAYLKKPVNIDVLAQTMRDAYRKLGKNAPPPTRPETA
jgi:two-component system response regulator CpxR